MRSTETLMAEILAADEARYQALYALDLQALAGLLQDDYLHTHATGKTETKPQFLASIGAAKYRFIEAVRSDQTLRLLGDGAILSGITHTTIEVATGRKTMHNAFATVWTRADGAWRLLHWQATQIATG